MLNSKVENNIVFIYLIKIKNAAQILLEEGEDELTDAEIDEILGIAGIDNGLNVESVFGIGMATIYIKKTIWSFVLKPKHISSITSNLSFQFFYNLYFCYDYLWLDPSLLDDDSIAFPGDYEYEEDFVNFTFNKVHLLLIISKAKHIPFPYAL